MILLMLICMPFSVFALALGDSDHVVAESAVVAAVIGDKFDLTSTDSHAVVSIPKDSLPDSVTEVHLDSKSFATKDEFSLGLFEQVKSNGYAGKQVCSFFLYDQNGELISLLNPVTVSVACAEFINLALALDKDNSVIEALPVAIKNSYATFDTTHLTYFILANEQAADAANEPNLGWMAVVGPALMAGGWLIFTLSSNSKKKG